MIPTNNTIPYTATPVVTYTLVGACVSAFLYQLSLSSLAEQEFLIDYALVPARYVDSAWAAKHGLSMVDPTPIFSSMFLHGGVFHILSNLWTLWVFGPALEDRLGSARFLGLYVIAGIAAGLMHTVFNLFSTIPALGASGAIAGVIAAYVRRFPYAWINVLQPIGLMPLFLFMPAVMFAGIWFMTQILQATSASLSPWSGGGVAWWAHIGGFLAGWFLLPRLAPTADAVEESRSAVASWIWPWKELQRWADWWRGRE